MIVGEMRLFAGKKAPNGWVFCEGQILSVASFSALFAVLGNAYGGDGVETFALPDMRGRVPIHSGQGAGLPTDYVLGDKGGLEAVTLTTSQMPDHSHDVNAVSALGNSQEPAGNLLSNTGNFDDEYSNAAPDITMGSNMIASSGGGEAHENRQPFLCVNYIIALFGNI